MAARTRSSIAILMVVVFFVAADFAIVRAVWDMHGPYINIAVTTLPTANLMLLVLPKLRRGRDVRPFWLGFEMIGWLMVLLVALVGWFQLDRIFSPLMWFAHLDPLQSGSVLEVAFLISVCVLFYTAPQLAAAIIGGWLAERLLGIGERRS